MYWAIGIILYITVGCNVAYLTLRDDDDFGHLVSIIIWPLVISGFSVYYLYKFVTIPSRLYIYWKIHKETDLRYWKWKKVGYDQEQNKIVRLK